MLTRQSEVLLVPLHRATDQLGPLWIVSDRLSHFHRGHVQAVSEVAAFISIALRMEQTEIALVLVALNYMG